jgi:hypothetical protein
MAMSPSESTSSLIVRGHVLFDDRRQHRRANRSPIVANSAIALGSSLASPLHDERS